MFFNEDVSNVLIDGYVFSTFFFDYVGSLWFHPNQNGGKDAHALDLRKLTTSFLRLTQIRI